MSYDLYEKQKYKILKNDKKRALKMLIYYVYNINIWHANV